MASFYLDENVSEQVRPLLERHGHHTIIARSIHRGRTSDHEALGNTLVHSVGGTLVLLVILVLNVYKPRGMTPYGWRKQQEERKALQP